MSTSATELPIYIVVGGGAGGLELATRLGNTLGRKRQARVVLIDQSPIHIWKPHLHEVAAGSLDVGLHRLEYAAQASWHHFEFQLGHLSALNRAARTVTVDAVLDSDGQPMLPARLLRYDTLVLALGSTINTFGIPGAYQHAIALDSPVQAERFRQKLIAACMRAETRAARGDPHQVSVAIIGAGATGVELAAELRRTSKVLAAYGIHRMNPNKDVRLTLIEGAERILPGLSPRISESVTQLLRQMDIDVLTGVRVTGVEPTQVLSAGRDPIAADLVVWAAGIKAAELLKDIDGLETNRINQLVVTDHLQTTRDTQVYALGDCAQCLWTEQRGNVPPRAQAAHQQASYLHALLMKQRRGASVGPFRYRDFGSLVSIGSQSAVGTLMGGVIGGSLFIEGLIAKLMYRSLYQMHMYALHGLWKTIVDAIANFLRRSTEPKVKLH